MFQKRIKIWPFPFLVTIWILVGLSISAFCVYAFAQLSKELLEKETFLFDQLIIDVVRSYPSPEMDQFMIFMTEMGSSKAIAVLLVAGMIWLWFKRRNLWGMLIYFIAVAGGGLLNLFLKHEFQRVRPSVNQIVEADGFSFPSGHAMGNLIFYGFLGYLVIRSKRRRFSKIGWGIVFGLTILLIGVSRIYLGVHYPSDIMAGYAAGTVWLLLCIALLEIISFYSAVTARKTTLKSGEQRGLAGDK
ncbi:undecaprenyl-diphosphatase [Bacillus fengqiuensis]|nr:undecaprenyl-diphosphatase [Bacillus fengqiuensis]